MGTNDKNEGQDSGPGRESRKGPASQLGSDAGRPGGPATSLLDSIRLPEGFDGGDGGGVKLLTTIPVRSPKKHEWFRVHPEHGAQIAAFRHRADRDELFAVHQSVCPLLADEITPMALRLCVTKQGVVFVWPLRLPGHDGRLDTWARSALEAATHAQEAWTRIRANMGLGAYEIYKATGDHPDPEWPEQSFEDLVQIAFRDRFIESADHPVLRDLRGES